MAYLFESNNMALARPNAEILVNTLNDMGILQSHEIFFLDLDRMAISLSLETDEVFSAKGVFSTEFFHDILSEEFMTSLRGNTVAIIYGRYDNNNDYNLAEYELLKKILQNVKKNIEDIQVIFFVPENKEKVVYRIHSLLGNPILTFKPEKFPILQEMSFKDAYMLAKKIANKLGMKPDKNLEKAVRIAQKDYSIQDIEEVVKTWRNEKLIIEQFPMYANVLSQSKETIEFNAKEDALARLDGLIGLSKTKEQIHKVLESVYAKQKRKERGLASSPQTYHLAFLGNPGTGKTIVAKLYAEILASHGIIKTNRVCTINGTVSHFYSSLEKGKGGVIIIDEAYELIKHPQRVTELLSFMEENRDDTIVIVAGYKAETMEVIRSNPGFMSRFAGFIDFEDYTAAEKIKIFDYMCKEEDFIIDSKARKYLEEEIINLPGTLEEGNARQVRNIFEKIRSELLVRVYKKYGLKKGEPTNKELMVLTVEDVRKALNVPEKTPDVSSLEDLIGLNNVKKLLKERLASFEAESYKIREGITDAANRMPMHMVFKGNPGTGKTEVAKIVGKLLKEKRVVGRGDLIEISPSDFVSPFSDEAVSRVFARAVGSILFLDEAYALADAPGANRIIAALMREMDKHKNDVILIMAGYTKEMDCLLSKNPGFNSRIAFQLEFPDYSEDELVKIFYSLAERESIQLTKGTEKYLKTLTVEEKHKPDFGNGRSMRNILNRLRIKQGVRLNKEIEAGHKHPKAYYRTITVQDFKALLDDSGLTVAEGKLNDGAKETAIQKLSELIGLQEAKDLIARFIAHFKLQRERVELGYATKQGNVSMHMAFTGSPGTGKTEVARLVAEILREEGLLPTGSFKEVGRQDLVGQYVGHTAPKIEALFKQSMGGVIFIDEAYSLLDTSGHDGFSQEAIDTLIAQMENHKDDTVVILAGYEDEINALLEANAGFRSRVSNIVHFADYSSEELYQILQLLAKKSEYKLARDVKKVVINAFEIARKSKDFGNGRFARNILESAIKEHSYRVKDKKIKTKEDFNLLTKEDFMVAIEDMNKKLVQEKHMGF